MKPKISYRILTYKIFYLRVIYVHLWKISILSTVTKEHARFDARLSKEQIIASEKDSQIFFGAITKPKKPSITLKNALGDYNTFVSDSKKWLNFWTKNIIEKILIVEKISKESYLLVLCYPKMKQVFNVTTYKSSSLPWFFNLWLGKNSIQYLIPFIYKFLH